MSKTITSIEGIGPAYAEKLETANGISQAWKTLTS